MKPHLLYADRDFDRLAEVPAGAGDLGVDLGLEDVWGAMGGGDAYLLDVARRVTLASLHRVPEITFRQQVAGDFLAHPEGLEQLYQTAVDAVAAERRVWGLVSRHPAGTLHHAVEVLMVLMPAARLLRDLAAGQAAGWKSPGLSRFAATLQDQLDDEYLALADSQVRTLRLEAGVLLSARLGAGGRASEYLLRQPGSGRVPWGERLGVRERSQHSFTVDPRDESGLRALAELTDRGLAEVANAVAQAADHVLAFFTALRFELGFYLGCLRLHQSLSGRGLAVCWPVPAQPDPVRLQARGLYDLGLAIRSGKAPVGNDLEAHGRPLLVVTGANSGGKSTFLRSLGLGQLLSQAGMFVGASEFTSSVATGVYTHFVRPEDDSMTRGRLADELDRMSRVADQVAPGGLVLMNESFSSTNELEGSEIGRQVVSAFLEAGVRVALVTHFYELAAGLSRTPPRPALALRAERLEDGRRTYRLLPAEPLRTAYGADLISRMDSAGSAQGHV